MLSVLLLSMSAAVTPYAICIEHESETYWVEALEDEYFFPDKNSDFIKPFAFYSNPNRCHSFGDYLDTNQRLLYDAIVKYNGGLTGTPSTVKYSDGTEMPAFKLEIKFPENSFIVKVKTAKDDIKSAVIGAITALIDDYPEYFWLSGFSYQYSYSTYSTDNYSVPKMELSLSIDANSYADCNTVKSCYNQLINAVNSFKITGNTRYAKIKSIHDGICKMTVYTMNVPMAHQPTGVFLKGQAVCEGYAEAFKLLCDRENIPCIIVVGTGNGGAHEWNYVQMEDGKWYGMDVTWDDQGTIYYDYFLTGSESINAVFGKTKFGNGTESGGDHINTGTHFSSSAFSLTYPVLSAQSYTGVIPMWDSEAVFDNSKGFMFIKKDAVANRQILCTYSSWAGNAPSTNKATVSGVTTCGKVNITSPVSRTYTIVRLGDVNKDNSVNSADYTEIRNIVLCKQKTYSDKAQFAAADVNGDGVIDAFDAIQLNCELHGVTD